MRLIRKGAIWVATACCCALIGGCAKPASHVPNPASRPVIPVPAPVASSVPAAHANMDLGKAASLTSTPELDAKIANLEKTGGSKTALAALYAKRGDARMMDEKASPHIKYPAALSDYRRALQLDPANKDAASNKAMIESIYRGMGLPVPK